MTMQGVESSPIPPPGKPIIGLIGGIGSGKSRVSAALTSLGGHLINADELGHQALRQPEILGQVVQRWGTGLLDAQGQIVRRRLGVIVFRDPAERKALEAMVHPWIGQAIRAEVKRAQDDMGVPFIVLDAAVMLEAGWYDVCDKLVFVDTPRELRLQRLLQQRGWTAQEVQARESAQLPLTEKAVRADHVLDNSGSLAQLDSQIEQLVRLWHLVSPGRRAGSG
jgi:dephospho-CoA kinase